MTINNSSHTTQHFEGVEKRLLIAYKPEELFKHKTVYTSLRDIPDEDWSNMLASTGCTILSKITSPNITIKQSPNEILEDHHSQPFMGPCTSFLLSESSAFVYDYSLMVKTCGTTAPLLMIEALANHLEISVEETTLFCVFSHFSYIQPEFQKYPHRSMKEEIDFLTHFYKHNEHMALTTGKNQDFFVFLGMCKDFDPIGYKLSSIEFTEAIMRGLHDDGIKNLAGIDHTQDNDSNDLKKLIHTPMGQLKAILPHDGIMNQYWFDPCGYSCNFIYSDGCFLDTHISPENAISYASIEVTKPIVKDKEDEKSNHTISQFVDCFKPKHLHILKVILKLDGKQSPITHQSLVGQNDPNLPYKSYRSASNSGSWYTISIDSCIQKVMNDTSLTTSYDNEDIHVHNKLYTQDPLIEYSSDKAIMSYLSDGLDADNIKIDIEKLTALINTHNNQYLKITQPSYNPQKPNKLDNLYKSYEPSDYLDIDRKLLLKYIHSTQPENPIVLANFGSILHQWKRWKMNLPRVEPFYSVKCNNDPILIEFMASLGVRFDCATKNEMEFIIKILSKYTFFDKDTHIAYSHTCKYPSALNWTREQGIYTTVFDNLDELEKISKHFPEAQLLLRIRSDDRDSQCPMSDKFGAPPERWADLISFCVDNKLTLKGVSFHVGSGCSRIGSFTATLMSARDAFDLASQYGVYMNFLDIGGGFPGDVYTKTPNKPTFEDLSSEINEALDKYFNHISNLRIIGEPGRYFAHSFYTLATQVFSRRIPLKLQQDHSIQLEKLSKFMEENTSQAHHNSVGVNPSVNSAIKDDINEMEFKEISKDDLIVSVDLDTKDDNHDDYVWLYINESLYGMFNCIFFDHASIQPELLSYYENEWVSIGDFLVDKVALKSKKINSSDVRIKKTKTVLFGQTCDGLDIILDCVKLPEMCVDDWFMFPNMGAYTLVASTNFNGFTKPTIFYVFVPPKTPFIQ